MAALNAQRKGRMHYLGVGGEGMEREGLASQFPIERRRRDGAVVDPAAAAAHHRACTSHGRSGHRRRARRRRHHRCPEFTHPIAKRIRKRAPQIPIIDYVSPSVWAWRPGRARKMRAYVDHVLALLPFEPQAHERARRSALHLYRPSADRAARLDAQARPLCACRPAAAGGRRALSSSCCRAAAPPRSGA